MKSVMASKSLNHFRWIDQLYFCPSPRKARRLAWKNPRAYASCATTLAKAALSHRLATQVRPTRAGGQAGSAAAAAVGRAGDIDMSVGTTSAAALPAAATAATAAADGAVDIDMSVDSAAAAAATAAAGRAGDSGKSVPGPAAPAGRAKDRGLSGGLAAAGGAATVPAAAGAGLGPAGTDGSADVPGPLAATTSSTDAKPPWAAWKSRTNSAMYGASRKQRG